MWRRRERFIGGYDPEHEMPDPDRDRGDRWQSPLYRYNARDSRYPYRWNPDRIEERFGYRGPEEYERYLGWHRDARDVHRYPPRYDYDREYRPPARFGPGDRGWDRGRGYDRDDRYYYEGDFGPPREYDWDDRDRYERERFGYERWRGRR